MTVRTPFSLKADCVIVAIGQRPQLKDCGLDKEIKTGPGGRALIDTRYATSTAAVFAAGDVASGPSTVVEAMAAGREAAGSIIEHLTGQACPFDKLTRETRGVGDYPEIPESLLRRRRPDAPQRLPRVRCRDFDEVDMGLSTDEAVAEAKRCLQCSVCCECRTCEQACEPHRRHQSFQYRARDSPYRRRPLSWPMPMSCRMPLCLIRNRSSGLPT